MKKDSLLKRFLVWRIRHISNRQFILILSILIGILSGLAAVIIKNSVHFIRHSLQTGITSEYHRYWYFVFPVIGIFFAILFIKYLIRQPVRHGIPNVLYGISKNNGMIKPHNMYSSVITSAFTVGFGGSVGLEGPTVATGAALGSNIGRLFHLNYKQITLLLGCASAGAMAAIFKAPIAAIVFALEVIMLDLTMASLIPLLLASVSATVTSYLFLGQDVLYPFHVTELFTFSHLPHYIALGVLAGFVSVYFTRVYMGIGQVFDKINGNYTKLIAGGLCLGLLIYLFPPLYGEGYEIINSAIQGNFEYLFDDTIFSSFADSLPAAIILLLGIVALKVVAASITFGSGGVGGIFAPTLFMGANTGLVFALISNHLGLEKIPLNNFAFMGMGGMIAGVLHAPLTAIFLIGDITSGYQLFLPLMIVATISYATVRLFETNSVYTIQLAKRKELITHDKDKAVLSLMKIEKLIETNFSTINTDATLGDLVKVVANSKRNIFPVTDEEQNFLGIVILDDIRNIMFNQEMYKDTFVRNLMFMPSVCVNLSESMEEVAHKFRETGNYNLPVIDQGKYLGFVSRANVFSTYRRMLKHFSED